jgi:hypothetical protein
VAKKLLISNNEPQKREDYSKISGKLPLTKLGGNSN